MADQMLISTKSNENIHQSSGVRGTDLSRLGSKVSYCRKFEIRVAMSGLPWATIA
jgi:hypothetical protein